MDEDGFGISFLLTSELRGNPVTRIESNSLPFTKITGLEGTTEVKETDIQ